MSTLDSPPGPASALVRLLGRLARRLHSLYAALGIHLVAGLVLSALALWGFGELADEVLEGTTRALDLAVLRWMEARATPALDEVAVEITALGSYAPVVALALVASAFLWAEGRRRSVALLWIANGGAVLLTTVMKNVFRRERPTLFAHGVDVTTFSFPSGHALQSMVAYATLAYLVGRVASSRALRLTTFAVAALVIVLVGTTRMYLGVHYPTDVLAGFAVGWVWATVCVLAVHVRNDVAGDADAPPGLA